MSSVLVTSIHPETLDGFSRILYVFLPVLPTLHCKKNGHKFSHCLEFLSHQQFFPSVLYKFILLTTVFFLNHTGRKKNFDSTDRKKSYPSVKKIFPLYLFKKCWNCSICGQKFFDLLPPHFLAVQQLNEIHMVEAENELPYCLFLDGIVKGAQV